MTGPKQDIQVIPLAARSEREIRLELALVKLCACKRYKEIYGKTESYERNKDQAWREAFELIGM